MRKTLIAIACALFAFVVPASAQDVKKDSTPNPAYERAGLVGGKDKVAVTMAEDKWSLRGFKKLTVGAECNLLPGDKVELISVSGDVAIVQREPGINIKPGEIASHIKKMERSKTCPTNAIVKTTNARWSAMNAAFVAAEKQKVVDQGNRKGFKKQ